MIAVVVVVLVVVVVAVIVVVVVFLSLAWHIVDSTARTKRLQLT